MKILHVTPLSRRMAQLQCVQSFTLKTVGHRKMCPTLCPTLCPTTVTTHAELSNLAVTCKKSHHMSRPHVTVTMHAEFGVHLISNVRCNVRCNFRKVAECIKHRNITQDITRNITYASPYTSSLHVAWSKIHHLCS